MSRAHIIAVGMINSRFVELLAGNTSAQLHAETSMAVEMAHSLGAIDTQEHSHYVQRLHRLYEMQAEAFLADIRRAAP